MTLTEILRHLEENGDANAKRIWLDFGIKTTDVYHGSQLTKLKEFAKKIKKNHELSLELWNSGVHDAKLLATMIEEPRKVSREQIEKQVLDIQTTDVSDKFVSNVVALTPFADDFAEKWRKSEAEYIKRSGFNILWVKAKKDPKPDEYYMPWLDQIAEELQQERNWVKETMNYALIAIGSRSKLLNEAATDVARRIGKVKIDYGNTSCKNPDPLQALTSSKTLEKLY